MFPEETHQKIVQRLDRLEAEIFRTYKSIERVRLDLQRQWRVLPSGERWTEERQQEAETNHG